MKKGKLVLKALLPFLLVVLFPALWWGINMLAFAHGNTWQYMAEFKQYEAEFTTVTNYILSEYAGGAETKLFLTNQDPVYELRNIDENRWVDLPEETALALQTLDRCAFPCNEADFDRIVVHGTQVGFGNDHGTYFLVFSPEEWPQRSYYAKEKEHFWVRIIGNGWYHVAITG